MGKRKGRQTSLVLQPHVAELADRLIAPLQAEELYRGKIEVTRSLVLRIAVADGIHALAAKYLSDDLTEEPDEGEDLAEEPEEDGTTEED